MRGGVVTRAAYDALTIAKWFIAWSEQTTESGLSNLKLQKLLYYAQGHYLTLKGRPLFRDPIQAWSHGPVVPKIYREFRQFGGDEFVLTEEDDFCWEDVDEETTQFLMKVWNTYGGLAAWRLRNMTHEEKPWREHFVDGGRNITITNESMRGYFANRTRVR